LQTMPEGSYTSHLFSSGPEKIRKKTGEEAIELLLADTPEQMLYEAADLVYHLMVLLVSENLSFDQVCAELQHRHLNG
ncbi:MAG: phosphoribosyl-ATP diphosphatase, partial [Sediminispirochaetaceae bacterium]